MARMMRNIMVDSDILFVFKIPTIFQKIDLLMLIENVSHSKKESICSILNYVLVNEAYDPCCSFTASTLDFHTSNFSVFSYEYSQYSAVQNHIQSTCKTS